MCKYWCRWIASAKMMGEISASSFISPVQFHCRQEGFSSEKVHCFGEAREPLQTAGTVFQVAVGRLLLFTSMMGCSIEWLHQYAFGPNSNLLKPVQCHPLMAGQESFLPPRKFRGSQCSLFGPFSAGQLYLHMYLMWMFYRTPEGYLVQLVQSKVIPD